MSDIETVAKENVQLKQQIANTSQGVYQLQNSIEAYKGELADARTISFQLRNNLINTQKSHQIIQAENEELRKKLAEANVKIAKYEASASAEVPPAA